MALQKNLLRIAMVIAAVFYFNTYDFSHSSNLPGNHCFLDEHPKG
jgi:hypothetical protein